jgi:hypothetical protein
MNPPVIDYERMKRLYPQVVTKEYNFVTCVCIFFITVGILVLIQKFKMKQVQPQDRRII